MRRLIPLLVTAVIGCATAREIAALRQVEFRFDRISGTRIAGVALDKIHSYDDLTAPDLARLGIALATKDVPLDLTLHLEATNPQTNDVTARLVAMDWAYWVDGRETVTGRLNEGYTFPPGEPRDVPLLVTFNLVDVFGGSGRDLVEVALALAGQRTSAHTVTMRLSPTIDTPVGPIRYPVPITLDVSASSAR